MRFDDRFLDDIKSRLRLSDVIGKTVKLKRQGREYAGLSPFTKEKTPSFYVNDEKGFFHCFSSGKHGDLISFLQETERLSFVEAVERLAAEAGMAMPEPDARSVEQEKKRQGLGEWLELATAWFEGELRRPAGKVARDYLVKRGLPEAEWARFRLGFAPNGRTALKDYLIAKGAKPGELVEAGLLIAPEDGGAPYDRFRDRIIFPIADARGRIVSFGGRAMDPQARAKYLNGPETSLFHKGHLVYGLPEARKLLHAGGDDAPLVVVEGYMDVIACQRANIAAVAPMGTALGEDQMEVLWRLHPEPTLCFDADAAGDRAAGRVIERALPLLQPERTFRFTRLTGGKDPDDVLREQGPSSLKAQLAQTTSFSEELFRREREQAEPLSTPERKTALKARLRKLAATIADKDLAYAYREDLLARYEALWPLKEPVYTLGGAGRALARKRWGDRGRRVPLVSDVTERGRLAAKRLRESPKPLSAALALAAVRDPRVVEEKIELLSAQGFRDSRLDQIANEIVALQLGGDPIRVDLVRKRIATRGFDDRELGELERTASKAHRLFVAEALESDLRTMWSHAFDLLLQVEALERAVAQAKEDMIRDRDSSTLIKLKTERDAVRRLIDTGAWMEGAPASAAVH